MPSKSLNKVQKHINKKKGNRVVLHEKSRDAQRLVAALSRSERVNKLAVNTSKVQLPYVERVAFFQNYVTSRDLKPLTNDEVCVAVSEMIARNDEDIQQLQSERRPGRPPTKQQEILQQRRDGEEKEYLSGLWMPILTEAENLEALQDWNQEWTSLGTLKFCRVSKSGVIHPSSFPPRGLS